MQKPKILIARAIPPAALERLAEHFDVEANQADELWSRAEFTQRMSGKDGAFTTGGERIDAELLAACPQVSALVTSRSLLRIQVSDQHIQAAQP